MILNTKAQHIKPKKAVAALPEGWEVKELRETGEITSGGTPDTTNSKYWNGTINWCTPTDITALKGAKYIGETQTKITEDGLRNSSSKLLPPGSIIVCTRATIGKVAIAEQPITTNQGFKNIIPNKSVNADYLYYSIINSEVDLLKYGNGSTFLEVSKSDFEKFSISFPPLPEQRAIASCLSTWDEAITKIQALIAQKEQRKKWLMQQLLTGMKRLKGFGRKWKEVSLKEIFEEVTERNDNKEHVIMTISARLGMISQQAKFDRVIAGDSLGKYTLIRKGDFAYNKGNSKLYEMGCVYQLETNDSALVPFVYICFRPTKKIDSGFYKHWFIAHGLDRQLKMIITSGARGDGLLNVNPDDFFTLVVPFPELKEQTAIAHVLQAADKEIQTLKQQLEKLKEQKKGLMQVLLTGKRRLKH